MTLSKILAAAALSLTMATPAFAGSITLSTVSTVTLTNVDDAAGRYQYDGGDILNSAGADIGDYWITRRVTFGATTTNQAPMTLVLLIDGRSTPSENITMHGLHSFSSGVAKGGIAAASSTMSYLNGGSFTHDAAAATLTLNW